MTDILRGATPIVLDSGSRICSSVLAMRCACTSKPCGNSTRKWGVLSWYHLIDGGLFSLVAVSCANKKVGSIAAKTIHLIHEINMACQVKRYFIKFIVGLAIFAFK